MTVEEFAIRQGITVDQAVALCVASGLAARGPANRLSVEDLARLDDVLNGRVALPDPKAVKRSGGKIPAARPALASRGAPGPAAIVGIVLAGLVLVGLALAAVTLRGGSDITVKPGDCFDATIVFGTVYGSGIEPRSCDGAKYRAYAILDLNEVFTDWPGPEKIEARAKDRCYALAEGRVEEELYTTTQLYYFGPADEVAWANEKSHKIVCAQRN